jgi:hypothetical protein
MAYKRTKEARDNAKNFYIMLSKKRYSMTEGEFQAWMSRHHSRTDPYSYKGSAQHARWRQSSRQSALKPVSNGSYYRSYMQNPTPRVRSTPNVYRFYSCRQRITESEQSWRKTLRVYS